MSVDVSIKGFQSIYDLSFPIKGFTTLVGPNYIGKSSTYRALNSAMRNRSGNAFISEGLKAAEVTLKFDYGQRDCHEVTWKKPRNKGASYIVDVENSYDHVGHGTPDFLHAIGMGDIELPQETRNKTLDPNFSAQFDLPFLLFESGGRLTKFFSSLLQFDAVGGAVKRCSKDVRDLNTEIRVLSKHKEALEVSVERFEGLDDVVTRLDTLSLLSSEHEGLKERLNSLVEYVVLDAQLDTVSRDLGRVSQTLETSITPDKLNLCAQIQLLVARLDEYAQESWLDGVEIPEVIDDSRLLEYLWVCLKLPDAVPDLPEDVSLLLEYLNAAISLYDTQKLYQEASTAVTELPDSTLLDYLYLKFSMFDFKPEIWERQLTVSQVLGTVAAFYLSCVDLFDLEEEIYEVSKQLEALEESFHTSLAALGECPLCGSSL